MTATTSIQGVAPERLRRRLVAAGGVAGSVALLAGLALLPIGADDPVRGDRAEAVRRLALVAPVREQVRWGYLAVVLGLALLAPVLVAISGLARGRGAVPATIGGALGGLAAGLGAAANASGLALYRLTDPAVGTEAAARVLTVPSGTVAPLVLPFAVLLPVGLALLGTGLWLTPGVPRWPAALLCVAAILFLGSSVGWPSALLTVPLAAAVVRLALLPAR